MHTIHRVFTKWDFFPAKHQAQTFYVSLERGQKNTVGAKFSPGRAKNQTV